MATVRDARPAAVDGLGELNLVTDLGDLFTAVYRSVAAAINADSCFVGLYDDVSRTIDVIRQVEFGVELPGGTFPLGDGPTSEVIRGRRARLIRRWSAEAPRVQVQYLSGTPGLPESAVIAPLLAGNQVLGVIAVHCYRADAFTLRDLRALETVAARTATVVARLRRANDPRTQLPPRVPELQAVLGTMPDAVLMVDAEARIVGLNRAARDMLCAEESGVVLGQRLHEEVWGQWPLGAPEVAATLAPVLDSLRRGERSREAEVRLGHRGGRILAFNCSPLADRHGTITGGVLVVRDVTAPHQADARKDEMLSIATHDLRTPVTVIRSEAQYLRRAVRRNAVTLDQIHDSLGSIVQQTERLGRLLSLLLDVSQIEAEITRRSIDLRVVASTTIAEVQATTDRHCLKLRVSGRTTIGSWDEARLRQVLSNLLINAVKYSPDGGAIDVHIRADKDELTVSVTDHGIGLAPSEAAHVFERFFRAPSTRQLEGSGLGLYICQSIVAAHGGRIWVESEGPGCGSTFRFTLPR